MDLLLQSDAALDQDRSAMQFIIFALLIVAALLGALTVWYWKQTDPTKSTSTISGAARYDSQDDDYFLDEQPLDDGYEQSEPYAGRRGPTHLPGDEPFKRSRNNVHRRPVARHGSTRQPTTPQDPAAANDAWAALTGADANEIDHR